MKKKVLFLITKSNWGGAQRYVYDLATGLDPAEFEPVVALGGNGELKDRLELYGIRVLSLSSLNRDISWRHEFKFIRDLYTIIKTERPEILHVNSSKAGGIGTLLGRICRVPKIIFTAHGWAFNEDRPSWQKGVIRLLHYWTVLLSHQTIMVSHALLEQLNLPGVRRRSKILSLGRSIGAMFNKTEARERLREIMKLPEPESSAEIWIGHIGELHPIKRQAVLIASAIPLLRHNPSLRLFIIGDGELAHTLATQVSQSGVANQIIMTGALQDAARFLKAFDIFVLCSRSEAYGYVAHEAGLAAVATIVTRVGGLPELIEDSVSGLTVPPDDPSALRDALERLIKNSEYRKQLAEAHHERMAERTLSRMIEATATLYRH